MHPTLPPVFTGKLHQWVSLVSGFLLCSVNGTTSQSEEVMTVRAGYLFHCSPLRSLKIKAISKQFLPRKAFFWPTISAFSLHPCVSWRANITSIIIGVPGGSPTVHPPFHKWSFC
jgi:hypothetical protein